jgi:hypothetical protein
LATCTHRLPICHPLAAHALLLDSFGAQYQLPNGNVNVYLPLTSIWDTNSLYVESRPGAEDFHPLVMDYGQLAIFYGVYCTHFAVTNATRATRVSLDFRLVPGNCYPATNADQDRDFQVGPTVSERSAPAYYSECSRDPQTGRFEVTHRGMPYWRHGFPHTNK